MKGFKPTGYGPSAGFKFPASFGFTGSTGAYTNVQPHVRHMPQPRAFRDGGYVSKVVGDQGSALERRARSSNNLDQVSGGKTPIRPGYKNGGKNWIKGAIKHPGALHKTLGVPAGEKIPAKKLAKAARSDNPTTRRRAALAKTLGKMHKADGGAVALRAMIERMRGTGQTSDAATARPQGGPLRAMIGRVKGAGPMSDREAQMMQRSVPNRSMTAREIDQMLRRALPRKPTMPVTGLKTKFYDDGGPVYGSSSKGFRSDLRKTGEFIGQIPRMVTDALKGTMRRTQEDVATDKRRRIDRIADGTASNYAKGGKMKRMGYQDGGYIATDWGNSDYGVEPLAQAKKHSQAGLREIKARVDKMNRFGKSTSYERRTAQSQADDLTSPNHRINLRTTKDVKPLYAKGGAAKHSDVAQDMPMMKRVAEKVIGEHVRYPAPKGHKGLGKMCK